MRRFFHNPYRALEQKLGYSFRNKDLLATALMHRSFRFETTGVDADNQRMEFLGDSALSLVSSDYLFNAFENLQEGSLTCLRSRLTSGKALAKIGRSIGLGEHLKLGKGERMSGGQHRPSNVTDAMEAILGAAYIDQGLKAVQKIFNKLFISLIEITPGDDWSDNPKGQLQAIAQRRWRTNPQYHVIRQEGPSHSKVFTVKAVINGIAQGIGRGSTKREAEQQAAQNTLQHLPERP